MVEDLIVRPAPSSPEAFEKIRKSEPEHGNRTKEKTSARELQPIGTTLTPGPPGKKIAPILDCDSNFLGTAVQEPSCIGQDFP
jgi:hypothetical protein